MKGDKNVVKQTKIGGLESASRNWKTMTNEYRSERLRQRLISEICLGVHPDCRPPVKITEGSWRMTQEIDSEEPMPRHFGDQNQE
jgi:hypothetical protein